MRVLITFVFVVPMVYVAADVWDDFNYLMQIFPGLYDNLNQYESDIHRGLPPQDRHLHLTTSVVVEDILNVPDLLGRTNFYLEQYLNGDKDNLIRQRIYSFALDDELKINLKLYSLLDQAKFAHAKPNSPLFQNLTTKDIDYAEGCDVYWTRVSNDLFRSNMFNTCIVPINGSKVLIIDKTTLSPTYLTADETWILVKNGSVILKYPGPYNMTRQKSIPADRNSLSVSPEASAYLNSFKTILHNLISGVPVRYYLKLSQCSQTDGSPSSIDIGGYIDAFEFFDNAHYGPMPFLGFSTFSQKMNESGHRIIQLREGLVYETDVVIVRMTSLTPDYRTVLQKQSFICKMGTPQSSGTAAFYAANSKVTMFNNFDQFVSALRSGAHVRFSTNYDLCSLGVAATGGGKIQDFEISEDGRMVNSSQYKIVSNYQGPGYVYDVVIGSFSIDGNATFIATDVAVDTQKVYYVEEIDCEIDGFKPGGAVRLYKID